MRRETKQGSKQMTMYKATQAYRRNEDGTLHMVTLMIEDNGTVCDILGYPMKSTQDTVTLMGWPGSANNTVKCDLYINDGGIEFLVPRRGAK
jgi:hypothetical protein